MAGKTRGRASDSTSDRSAEPPAKRPMAMANVLSIGYVKQHEVAGFKGKHEVHRIDGSSTVVVVQMSGAERPVGSPADGFGVDLHDKLVQVAS